MDELINVHGGARTDRDGRLQIIRRDLKSRHSVTADQLEGVPRLPASPRSSIPRTCRQRHR
jgi:hypothetical protein